MSYILVQKGDKKATVSETSFETIFKQTGWSRVYQDEVPNTANDNVTPDETEESEWDEVEENAEMEALLEKPLSELTNDEVKEVAFYKGIDTEGKSIKQLKELIRKNS